MLAAVAYWLRVFQDAGTPYQADVMIGDAVNHRTVATNNTTQAFSLGCCFIFSVGKKICLAKSLPKITILRRLLKLNPLNTGENKWHQQ